MTTYGYQLAGDYNGDGYADILWYQPGPGADSRWSSVPVAWVPQA